MSLQPQVSIHGLGQLIAIGCRAANVVRRRIHFHNFGQPFMPGRIFESHVAVVHWMVDDIVRALINLEFGISHPIQPNLVAQKLDSLRSQLQLWAIFILVWCHFGISMNFTREWNRSWTKILWIPGNSMPNNAFDDSEIDFIEDIILDDFIVDRQGFICDCIEKWNNKVRPNSETSFTLQRSCTICSRFCGTHRICKACGEPQHDDHASCNWLMFHKPRKSYTEKSVGEVFLGLSRFSCRRSALNKNDLNSNHLNQNTTWECASNRQAVPFCWSPASIRDGFLARLEGYLWEFCFSICVLLFLPWNQPGLLKLNVRPPCRWSLSWTCFLDQ